MTAPVLYRWFRIRPCPTRQIFYSRAALPPAVVGPYRGFQRSSRPMKIQGLRTRIIFVQQSHVEQSLLGRYNKLCFPREILKRVARRVYWRR